MRGSRQSSDGFAELVSEQGRGWVAAASVVIGDAGRAEEIVQEVLVRVYRRWSRVQALDRPGAFVRRSVINEAISTRRRRVRETAAVATLSARAGASPLPDPTAAAADRDQRLWAAVRSLPPDQMRAIALRYAGDASLGEVAAALGVTEAAARTLLHRARQELRRTLESQPVLDLRSPHEVEPSPASAEEVMP